MFASLKSIAKFVVVTALASTLFGVSLAMAGGPDILEMKCRRKGMLDSEMTPAECTLTVLQDVVDMCPKLNQVLVLTASCSDQVITIPDDACDGAGGACVPPTFVGGALKSLTNRATPSVTVNSCIDPFETECDCIVDVVSQLSYGRRVCTSH